MRFIATLIFVILLPFSLLSKNPNLGDVQAVEEVAASSDSQEADSIKLDEKLKISFRSSKKEIGKLAIKCFQNKPEIEASIKRRIKGLGTIGVDIPVDEFTKKALDIADMLYEQDNHKKLDAEAVMDATASYFIK